MGIVLLPAQKEYFRPLEVDTLLGNSNKAKKELKWKPKISFKELVDEMVDYDLKRIMND